jgi:hypothetical protein
MTLERTPSNFLDKKTVKIRQNPITSDPALKKLLAETTWKTNADEDAFQGWRQSFLNVYENYLDPAGVKNAHMADERLVQALQRLAKVVVNVQELVQSGAITASSQTVKGKQSMTDMTDQMARSKYFYSVLSV